MEHKDNKAITTTEIADYLEGILEESVCEGCRGTSNGGTCLGCRGLRYVALDFNRSYIEDGHDIFSKIERLVMELRSKKD